MSRVVILLFVALVLCSVSVMAINAAVYVPIIAAASSNNDAVRSGGCFPPINFSIEMGCELSYSTRWSVNTFDCEQYIIEGDCMGGVISSRINPDYMKVDTLVKSAFVTIVIVIGIAGIFILGWLNG